MAEAHPLGTAQYLRASTRLGNFIFRDQMTGRSGIYRSLKIQISIRNINYLNVKKTPLFPILRVSKRLTSMRLEKSQMLPVVRYQICRSRTAMNIRQSLRLSIFSIPTYVTIYELPSIHPTAFMGHPSRVLCAGQTIDFLDK